MKKFLGYIKLIIFAIVLILGLDALINALVYLTSNIVLFVIIVPMVVAFIGGALKNGANF